MGRDDLLTKSKDFSPIPTAPAIIQCGVPRAGTHLPGRQSSKIYVCPLLFNGLTVRASHTRRIIERILNLALRAMRSQVKLWYEVRKGEFGQVEIFVGGTETFVKIDGPLAGDVVGYFDISDLTTLEVFGDNIIRVDLTIIRLVH